jgi:hypothetical protein
VHDRSARPGDDGGMDRDDTSAGARCKPYAWYGGEASGPGRGGAGKPASGFASRWPRRGSSASSEPCVSFRPRLEHRIGKLKE